MTESVILTRAAWSLHQVPGGLAWLRAAPLATGIAVQIWFGERREAALAAGVLVFGAIVATHLGGPSRLRGDACDGGRAPSEIRSNRMAAQLIALTSVAAFVALWLNGDVRAFSAVLLVVASCGISPGIRITLHRAAADTVRSGSHDHPGDLVQRLSSIDTIAFDMAALVANGELRVYGVYPASGVSVREVLERAAAAQFDATDPVGAAIISYATTAGICPLGPTRLLTRTGHYVRALVGSEEIVVCDAALLAAARLSTLSSSATGWMTMCVMRDHRYLGALVLGHALKPGIGRAIAALRSMKITTRLITVESAGTVEALSRDVRLDAYEAGLTAARAADRMRMVRAMPTVAVVEDGVASADPRDRALTAADLPLLADAITRARRARAIIHQNLFGTLIVNSVGIGLAAAGTLMPVPAATVHAACDVLFVANARRS